MTSAAELPSMGERLGLIECEVGEVRFNLEPMDSTDMNTVTVGSKATTIYEESEPIICFSMKHRTYVIVDLSICRDCRTIPR
jgi:hypothetical protein